MKKKILNIILVTVAIASLMGCSSKNVESVEKSGNTNISEKEFIDLDILDTDSIDESEETDDFKKDDDLYRIDGIAIKTNGQEEFLFGRYATFSYEYDEFDTMFEFDLAYKDHITVRYIGKEAEKNKDIILSLIEAEGFEFSSLHDFLYLYIDDKDLKEIDREEDLYEVDHIEFYDKNGDKFNIENDIDKLVTMAKVYREVYDTYLSNDNEEYIANYESIPYAPEVIGVCLGDWSTYDDFGTFRQYGYRIMHKYDGKELTGDADGYLLYKGDLCGEYVLSKAHVEPDGFTCVTGKYNWDTSETY